ncbi:MAG: HNH endonuclease, partial [Spirulina sp.]
KYELIAKEQNWKCPICQDSLFNGEKIETHHIKPVKEGGSDDKENLIHLHKACHKQVHSTGRLDMLNSIQHPSPSKPKLNGLK